MAGFGKYPKYEPTTNHFRNYVTKDVIWSASTIPKEKKDGKTCYITSIIT